MRWILFLAILIMSSCSTKFLTSKVSDPKKDSFKKESFLRYSNDRLEKLEDTSFKGLSLCYQGKISEGKETLLHELKKRKDDPAYWNELGVCTFLEENYGKADFYFDLSLEKARKGYFPPALNNKGVLKLRLRHYESALDYFKKAVGRRKEHMVPLFNMAQVYLQFNLLDQAGPLMEDIYKRNEKENVKEDPDLLFSLGSVYLLKGQTRKAMSFFTKIPSNYQKREDVTLVTAIGLYEEKQYYKAKEVLEGQNFINYVPLKRSAQKLSELIETEIKKIEAALAKKQG